MKDQGYILGYIIYKSLTSLACGSAVSLKPEKDKKIMKCYRNNIKQNIRMYSNAEG